MCRPVCLHFAMKSPVLFLAVTGLALTAAAESQTYDFRDTNGINKIVFTSYDSLKPFRGTATNVAGSVSFDIANPTALKGRITVRTASVHVADTALQRDLTGTAVLDAARHPEISFETASVANIQPEAGNSNNFTATVSGTLTLKGVARPVTLPVKISYIPNRLRERNPELQGDLLRINANLEIKPADFGLNAGVTGGPEAGLIHLNFSLSGSSPRQP